MFLCMWGGVGVSFGHGPVDRSAIAGVAMGTVFCLGAVAALEG